MPIKILILGSTGTLGKELVDLFNGDKKYSVTTWSHKDIDVTDILLLNQKIKESLPVSYEDIPILEAEKRGAIRLFEEKYGDIVRVYKVGDFSLEFCGGPHVKNTSELGNFKITKEEAMKFIKEEFKIQIITRGEENELQ